MKKPPQTGPQQKQPAVEKPDPATQIKQFAEQAKEALRNRNYGQALKMADQIVAQAPKDADALQFRCLVHLGLGDYASSARDAYNAVQLGPLWNEATLKQLYGDLAVHDRQLQLLQLTCQAQPDALAIHFVRAHQHLLRGQLEAGRAALQDVLRVRPEDPIATRLLAAVPPTDTTDVAADGF